MKNKLSISLASLLGYKNITTLAVQNSKNKPHYCLSGRILFLSQETRIKNYLNHYYKIVVQDKKVYVYKTLEY